MSLSRSGLGNRFLHFLSLVKIKHVVKRLPCPAFVLWLGLLVCLTKIKQMSHGLV